MPKVTFSSVGARVRSIRGAMALGLVILANPAAAQKDGEIQAMKQEIRTLQQQLNAMQRRVAARPEPARKGGSVAKGAE